MTFLYRFEFAGIPLDSMAINAVSVTDAIQNIRIMFGESTYRQIEPYICSIHKID